MDIHKIINVYETINTTLIEYGVGAIGIDIHYLGLKNPSWDNLQHDCFSVLIMNRTTKESYSFEFFDSFNNTALRTRAVVGHATRDDVKKICDANHNLVYSIACCIKTDVCIPDTFNAFCSEFGYDDDSIKALKLFEICKPHAQNILRVFGKDFDFSVLPD